MAGFLRILAISLILCSLAPFAHAGEDWLSITPEELTMTSEPRAPGAPAVYLYRQYDRDNPKFREYFYVRIKILTEEGRKYANVEIPFQKGIGKIKSIQARTIHQDGTVFNFDGSIYEKMIVKSKYVKWLAKTFTLPDVQVGSIIEYRYDRTPDGYYPPLWLLSGDLFTKRARFSFHRNDLGIIEWSWPLGLPPGTSPPTEDHHTIRLECENVPAFEAEDHMPPHDEMKYRVVFTDVLRGQKDPEKFWKAEGKAQYQKVEEFIDKHKVMEKAVAEIIFPSERPEVKLQKIYARTLQIHNSSFERVKTEQETSREKKPEISTVEDVWKSGYGNRWAINWLFLALARAAGLDASPVLISTRDEHFFDRHQLDANLLNASVVAVTLNGQELYLDPGTLFAPFGVLPWYETNVPGLRLDKDGGNWIMTPLPPASESRIERTAALQLTNDGSLEGKVNITFVGMEALWRRLYECNESDQSRETFLENAVKEYISSAIEIQLTNKPDWDTAAPTLVAEFSVKIPGWASTTGRHILFPLGLFGGTEEHIFEHAVRVYPIYFNFPYQNLDDISVTLPVGMQVSDVGDARTVDVKACVYSLTSKNDKNSLRSTRQLTVNLGSVEAKYYAALRNFYQQVRAADQQPVVLSAPATPAQN
jgi:transglutaminase-like putative cysteine protease